MENGRCKDTGGVTLWQVIKERGVVEGRPWQSLTERFKRSIVNRLDLFGLDEQQEEQLRQGGRRGEKQKVQFAETWLCPKPMA